MFCEGNPCKRCGAETRAGFLRVCNDDWPAGVIMPQRQQLPGLGDYVESLLQSVGVTKERYKAAKELFGLPPTCSCDSRREWLNRVSDWWRGCIDS